MIHRSPRRANKRCTTEHHQAERKEWWPGTGAGSEASASHQKVGWGGGGSKVSGNFSGPHDLEVQRKYKGLDLCSPKINTAKGGISVTKAHPTSLLTELGLPLLSIHHQCVPSRLDYLRQAASPNGSGKLYVCIETGDVICFPVINHSQQCWECR